MIYGLTLLRPSGCHEAAVCIYLSALCGVVSCIHCSFCPTRTVWPICLFYKNNCFTCEMSARDSGQLHKAYQLQNILTNVLMLADMANIKHATLAPVIKTSTLYTSGDLEVITSDAVRFFIPSYVMIDTS